MKFRKILSIVLLLLAPSQLMANDWTNSNKKIAEEFAIPRYQALNEASKALVKQANSFCETVDETSFKKTREHFLETMNAWQQVQLFRLGPAELFMRHFRLEMWPDRSNTGAKQISRLLSEKSLDALNAKTFSRASTAVQGLPAMERLLYAKNVNAQLFSKDGKANYRCKLLKAISVNINGMSHDLLNDWQGKYLKDITNPGEENDYFESHKEISSQFLKELATQLQAVMDQKFKRPLGGGKNGKRFRPKRAESWRSSHSLHNIVENLKSTEQLFLIGFAPLLTNKESEKVLRKKLEEQFTQAIRTGEKLDVSLKEAYQKHKSLLDDWILQISKLKKTVTQELPKALDIPLGFNSLDGD